MARTKLKRISEIPNLNNAFTPADETKGLWKSQIFKNNNHLVLELACGWGQYSLSMATKYPQKNFIGIDKKGDRLWHGANLASEANLDNVAFLRTLIEQLENFFAPEEVDEIWITFPDPFEKPSKSNRRLTSESFLEIYKKILKKKGLIHLKTDNQRLFNFTLETLNKLKITPLQIETDVHSLDPIPEDLSIKTFYEDKFSKIGHKIKYIKFSLN